MDDTLRDDFCAALDATPPGECDAIVVLRNHDPKLLEERIEHAIKLSASIGIKLIVLPFAANTKEEAEQVLSVAMKAGWAAITIVTHRSHHYRAWLTFLKTVSCCNMLLLDVYSSPVESGWSEEEFNKIEEYQRKGDVATYKEGLDVLGNQ